MPPKAGARGARPQEGALWCDTRQRNEFAQSGCQRNCGVLRSLRQEIVPAFVLLVGGESRKKTPARHRGPSVARRRNLTPREMLF